MTVAAGRGLDDHQHVPLVEVMVDEPLDASSAPRLGRLLTEALTLCPDELVVDLAGCPAVDATAIGVLVDAHRRAVRAGSVLTLRSPSYRLRRNLHLARVDGVLHITPREDPSDGRRPPDWADPSMTAGPASGPGASSDVGVDRG